ncbi:MAG: hypothetical protein ACI4SC_01885 [Candidatus Neoclostridium sp.]
MKKATAYILICLTTVMALIGAIIWWSIYTKPEERKAADVEISLDGETTRDLRVDISNIVPGSSHQYDILLTASNAREYSVVLKFVGDGEIKDYVDIEIITDGENLAGEKKRLADLLGNEVALGKGASRITIVYSMPLETGNEAQSTEAWFDIELTATLLADNGDEQ